MFSLIVGLGNPGAKYCLTRHNIGFLFADALLKALQIDTQKEELNAHTFRSTWVSRNGNKHPVMIAKPLTYMNRSGEAVRDILHFYKIPIEKMIVVHDDIDLPFGDFRFHQNRGAGGNNGIKSIHEVLGTQDYARLKMGIGRPPHPNFPVADYVLQNFSQAEQEELPEVLNFGADAIEVYLDQGFGKAASLYNRNYQDKLPNQR